jgi:hypothetical protein
MNSQRVSLMAGNEDMSVVDFEPVVATGSTAFDPEIRVHSRSAVLDVEATADFDNQRISLEIRSNVVAGATRREQIGNVTVVAAGEIIEVEEDDEAGGEQDDDDGEQRDVVRGPKRRMAQDAIFEMTEQDITKYRTTVRIPSGGALLLAGGSDQFKHIDSAQDVEVVMILEASVMQ